MNSMVKYVLIAFSVCSCASHHSAEPTDRAGSADVPTDAGTAPADAAAEAGDPPIGTPGPNGEPWPCGYTAGWDTFKTCGRGVDPFDGSTNVICPDTCPSGAQCGGTFVNSNSCTPDPGGTLVGPDGGSCPTVVYPYLCVMPCPLNATTATIPALAPPSDDNPMGEPWGMLLVCN